MKIGEEKNIKLTDDPKVLTEIDEQIKQASIENKKIKKRLKGMKQIIGGIIVISVDHTSYLRRKFYSLKIGFITIVGCHERTLEKVIYREV